MSQIVLSAEPAVEENVSRSNGVAVWQDSVDVAALEREFRRLAEQWRSETMAMSSSTDIALHPAYYQMIGMGAVVVPWILRELQQNGGHWFLALRAITRQNPVKPEERGQIKKMTAAWLKWGEERGLLDFAH